MAGGVGWVRWGSGCGARAISSTSRRATAREPRAHALGGVAGGPAGRVRPGNLARSGDARLRRWHPGQAEQTVARGAGLGS